MLKLILTAAIAAVAVQGSAAAEANRPQRFQLMAEVTDGTAAPLHPRLLIQAGEPATIQIANERYAFRLTATPDAASNVAVASLVTSWTPSGLVHQDRQAQVRADGTPVHLVFDRVEPGNGAHRRIDVDLRVVPAE